MAVVVHAIEVWSPNARETNMKIVAVVLAMALLVAGSATAFAGKGDGGRKCYDAEKKKYVKC